jgi:2-C-methyl-D-erythritol 2,4-cyclodiphosphate synthase
MRTGIGFDIHKFETGRKFFLGGMEISYHQGLAGHSDGDVLLHSLADSILGAMGKSDIGCYFPDSDESIKNIDSKKIIKKVLKIMQEENYSIGNIDIVVICQEPKLNPHFPEIKENLAKILGVNETDIGLKAKTFEKMGEIGQGKACACLSSILLEKNN